MAKTKKTNGKGKAHAQTETKFESNGRKQATHMMARMQDGFCEAGEAFREAGEAMGGESRKVVLTLVDHAQDNFVRSLDAFRETIQAQTFAEAAKIQQHAFTDMFRRNLKQMREVSEIIAASSTKSLKPITKFVSALRDQRAA